MKLKSSRPNKITQTKGAPVSNEDLEKRAAEAKNYPYPPASKIDADFFNINSRSYKAKVLFNDNPVFTYSNNEDILYTLIEPVFVQRMVIYPHESKFKDVEVVISKANGDEHVYALKENKDSYSFNINSIIVSIQFIVPKHFFRKQRLSFSKIEIYGRAQSELESLEKASKEIKTFHDQLKADAASLISTNKDTLAKIQKAQEDLTNEHTNLDEEIETFKQEIKELSESKAIKELELGTEKAELEVLKAQTALVQNNHDSLLKTEQTLSDSIEQKKFLITDLNSKIVKIEQELREKDERKSLLAYDVEGFVKNAKSNINVYIGLSAAPWILICVVTYFLFKNTEVLAAIYQLKKEDVDLATIFWSRLPFAMIVSSILFVSYEISISFAKKIIDLHQRILDLQKIGIIARDVSEASLTNLNEFTDEEKYELRAKLKMDLLRSHLAKDFSTKEPFKVSNPHTWIKFLKAKETPKDKAHQDEAKSKPEETHAEE